MNQSDLDNIVYNMFTNGDITLSEYIKYQNRDKIMTRQDELNEAWCSYMGKFSTELMQALAFALRWADQHPHWISVEDELPKERDWYLIYDSNMGHDVCMWYGDCWGNCYKVTHWMPLPSIETIKNKNYET